jgi:hypothetical protein
MLIVILPVKNADTRIIQKKWPLNAEKEQEEILVNQTTVCCSD